MAKSTAVLSPNLGLYLDRGPLTVPLRAVQSGENFRIRNGQLNNLNLGWSRFSDFTLDGPVRLIERFVTRNSGEHLVLADEDDIYVYDIGTDAILFLTPRYATGTCSVSGANPAVVTFSTGYTTNIKVGDKIHFGSSSQRDPAAVWYEVAELTTATTVTLTTAVAGAPLGGGTLFTVRKIFTMDADDWWDTAVYINDGASDDYLILTNGIDFVVSWDGNDTSVTVQSAMNFKCRAVANYEGMMVYGNLTYGGGALVNQILNSDPTAGPFAAGDAGSGLADQFRIHGGSDPIVSLRTLGGDLIAYSERHVTHIEFVGDPLVFVFRQSVTGTGPVGHSAIADFTDYQQFVGPDTMYRYDGVSVEEEDTHLWREVLRQQDPVRRFRTKSFFVEELGELMWSIPLTTDAGSGTVSSPPAVAFTAHYLEEVGNQTPTPYSKRSLPFTAFGYFERQASLRWSDMTETWQDYNFRWNDQFFAIAFPQVLAGNEAGEVYILNETQDANGTPLDSYVRFGRRALGDGRMRGLLKRVYPFCEPRDSVLTITTYLMDHAHGAATISHDEEFDQNLVEGGHFVSPFRRGRFMELEFGSETEAWTLTGYDIDIVPGGLR